MALVALLFVIGVRPDFAGLLAGVANGVDAGISRDHEPAIDANVAAFRGILSSPTPLRRVRRQANLPYTGACV